MSRDMITRAQSLLDRGGVEEKPGTRVFDIQGSLNATYRVLAYARGRGSWAITCTCPAGIVGKKCYHACAVLMLLREDDVEDPAGAILSKAQEAFKGDPPQSRRRR